ncbi:MAG: translation initiation factor IF-3 [Patescibacteria group bacterium]
MPPKHFQKRLRINHQIRVPEVQVIADDGKALGTMPTYEALRLAEERGFDVVEVGPQAKPPLVKIMDYGKYLYQREKKERGQKTGKSTAQEVKTVKIGFKTEKHDLLIRAGQADKFLQKGYRVRLELTLRGREKQMADLGRKKLEEFTKLISRPFGTDDPIKRFPGGLGILIKPEKK